jgi:hypothetical protein
MAHLLVSGNNGDAPSAAVRVQLLRGADTNLAVRFRDRAVRLLPL